jgi:hypothetical protein
MLDTQVREGMLLSDLKPMKGVIFIPLRESLSQLGAPKCHHFSIQGASVDSQRKGAVTMQIVLIIRGPKLRPCE